MEFLVVLVVLGIVTGMVARSKGYEFWPWFFYGALIFIVAIVHIILKPPLRRSVEQRRIAEEGLLKCPFCAELVKREARICRYCQRDLPERPTEEELQ